MKATQHISMCKGGLRMGEIISTVTGWIWTIAIFILFIAMLALILIALDAVLSNIAKARRWLKKNRGRW